MERIQLFDICCFPVTKPELLRTERRQRVQFMCKPSNRRVDRRVDRDHARSRHWHCARPLDRRRCPSCNGRRRKSMLSTVRPKISPCLSPQPASSIGAARNSAGWPSTTLWAVSVDQGTVGVGSSGFRPRLLRYRRRQSRAALAAPARRLVNPGVVSAKGAGTVPVEDANDSGMPAARGSGYFASVRALAQNARRVIIAWSTVVSTSPSSSARAG